MGLFNFPTIIAYSTRYGATAGTAEEIAKILRQYNWHRGHGNSCITNPPDKLDVRRENGQIVEHRGKRVRLSLKYEKEGD